MIPFVDWSQAPEDRSQVPECRVLVVGDDLCSDLSDALQRARFHLRRASESEMRAACERHHPDLVLVSGANSISTCGALRAEPTAVDLPIVVQIDGAATVDRAIQAGATTFFSSADEPAAFVGRLRCVLRDARTRSGLRRTCELQARVHRIAALGYLTMDWAEDLVCVSTEAARILGCGTTATKLTWEEYLDRVHDEDRHRIRRSFADLSAGASLRVEHRLATSTSEAVYVCQEAEAARSPGGGLVVTTTIQDVTDRKRAEGHVIRLAYYDELTGLPNRTFLNDALGHLVEGCVESDDRFALMSIAIEGLNQIVDTFGHDAADHLLKMIAERLGHLPENTDTVTPEDTLSLDDTHSDGGTLLARVSVSSFMFVFRGIQDEDELQRYAERIHKTLSEPVEVADHPMVPTAGIGLAMYPDHGKSASTLMKNVETAQHQAVSSGPSRCVMFTEALYESARARVTLEMALRRALEQGAFELHYQPKLDSQTEATVGMEALLRWTDAEFGAVSPARFIPIAEENGLIVPIGTWVLKTACAQTAAWRASGYPDLRVAVNISAEQFLRPDFVHTVQDALQSTQLAPIGLELEITESLLMRDTTVAVRHLNELRQLGVRVALDDFGTGYSSLSYLHRFPLDTLKIDRSFVSDMTHKPDVATIVRAIILMSHSLNLRVVAEGVEAREQLEELRRLGCEEIQGFYFSRALPRGAFDEWLRKRARPHPIPSAIGLN